MSEEDEVEYELEDFQLGDHLISITTIAYLPITTLLANQSKSVEISGQKLWCGSLCLVNHLFAHPEKAQGSVFIELGAGTGVVSMMAHRLGAKLAIATDHDQRSLDHMQKDFVLNNCNVLVERLDWYEPDLTAISAAVGSGDPGDVYLIAGDVLYKHVLLEPFFRTVSALLALYPKAKLILCHVPRAGVEPADVLQAASRAGLVADLQHDAMDPQLATHCPEEDIVRATLYVMSKAL